MVLQGVKEKLGRAGPTDGVAGSISLVPVSEAITGAPEFIWPAYIYLAGERLPTVERLTALRSEIAAGQPSTLTKQELIALLCAARLLASGTSALFPPNCRADQRDAGETINPAQFRHIGVE